ncbi:MAG TPA: hypothetical protein VFI11_06315 [Anaerolineales bacterium]|nr:hypothetical protein [Anaerolineales bacterium]
MADGERLGEVVHYFDHVQVAVVRLSRALKQGQRLHFHGAHTDFEQVAASLQVDHKPVDGAAPGSEVAVKVDQRARRGDDVFEVV